MLKALLYVNLIWGMVWSGLLAQEKPNILFVVCDDLNTHIKALGYPHIQTPNIDALAKSGMTFPNAFCQYPVCGPSRASFMHGLYPESTGIWDNKTDIRKTRPGVLSMPEHFKKHGYWTASVGKVFHNKSKDQPTRVWDESVHFSNDELAAVLKAQKKFEAEHGAITKSKNREAWRALYKKIKEPLAAQTPPGKGASGLKDEQHKDAKNAKQVIDWLARKPYGDQPFFIAMGIHKPHVPFLAPDKYFDMYPKNKLKYRVNRSDLWESLPKSAMPHRYTAFGFEFSKEKEGLRREYMQAYHACISFIDAQLGLVMKQLKAQGLWENTVVIFTSDHGYHLGDHFIWGKVTLFDIGARVPFFMRVPGMTEEGSVSKTMVELIDVFPTLSDLAGIPIPESLEGRTLKPYLKGKSHVGEDLFAYSVVTRGNVKGETIRNQTWRYGFWPDGEELYDLEKDREELQNLAKHPEYQKILFEMRAHLKQVQKKF